MSVTDIRSQQLEVQLSSDREGKELANELLTMDLNCLLLLDHFIDNDVDTILRDITMLETGVRKCDKDG
jgi:hypothetical protein